LNILTTTFAMLQCILKLYFQQTAASNRRWSLSRVEWVRPELVAEVKYLTWTGNNLLR
jgi:ATP-dependent DNA ligase